MRFAPARLTRSRLLAGILALPLLCLASPSAPPGLVPDFALEDVNSTSATFAQLVSPRDHVGRVSAWYFGTAT